MLVNLFFMAWCRINTVFLFGLVSTVFDETSFFWFIAIIGSWIFVWHFFWLVGLDVVLFLKVILMGSNALVLLLHPEALVSHPLSLFGQHHKFFRLTWCFEILQQLNLYFFKRSTSHVDPSQGSARLPMFFAVVKISGVEGELLILFRWNSFFWRVNSMDWCNIYRNPQ